VRLEARARRHRIGRAAGVGLTLSIALLPAAVVFELAWQERDRWLSAGDADTPGATVVEGWISNPYVRLRTLGRWRRVQYLCASGATLVVWRTTLDGRAVERRRFAPAK